MSRVLDTGANPSAISRSLNAADYRNRTGAVLRGSLTTLRPVTVLPIAEEPILDFTMNAVKPLFRMERVLLHLLHLLLQLFGTVFSGSKLHPELMRCLSGVLIICLSSRGRLLKQCDNCRS